MFIGQCPHWLPFYRLILNAGSCPLKTFLLVSAKISISLSLGSPSFYQKLIKLFYFKQVVNQQTVLKNNAETSQLPFIQFPQMVTSCKAVVWSHRQHMDIDAVNVQNSSISTRILCVALYNHTTSPSLSFLAPGNHYSVSHIYNFVIWRMLYK